MSDDPLISFLVAILKSQHNVSNNEEERKKFEFEHYKKTLSGIRLKQIENLKIPEDVKKQLITKVEEMKKSQSLQELASKEEELRKNVQKATEN